MNIDNNTLILIVLGIIVCMSMTDKTEGFRPRRRHRRRWRRRWNRWNRGWYPYYNYGWGYPYYYGYTEPDVVVVKKEVKEEPKPTPVPVAPTKTTIDPTTMLVIGGLFILFMMSQQQNRYF